MTVGYSGTPLAKKLGIKEGFVVATVNAPGNYLQLLESLPKDVEIDALESVKPLLTRRLPQPLDLVHLFTNSRDELFRSLADLRNAIKQDGSIWVSWYKKAAKLPTEITEDTVREAAFPLGLVDVKVCAVDEKWSGLKLVIRKENRSK
ncbi:MAG: DUF3052 family protein [Acidobacteria bacterium]|nr:DUF3052 family protein [Acidobacteriota bacterium]